MINWFRPGAPPPEDVAGYRIYTTALDVETTRAALTRRLTASEHAGRSEESGGRVHSGEARISGVRHGCVPCGDLSGSMKGANGALACLAVEGLADFPGHIGLRYELLGFASASWRGGSARHKWDVWDRPPNPGRLAERMHILYCSTDDHGGGALRDVRHLLRPKLLTENIDGEALLWAAQWLRTVTAARKVVIMLSDGAPVDDSTLSVNGPKILWDHLLTVIRDLQYEGFRVIGIGINHGVPNPYGLHGQIGRLMRPGLRFGRLFLTFSNDFTGCRLRTGALICCRTTLDAQTSCVRTGAAVSTANPGPMPDQRPRFRPLPR